MIGRIGAWVASTEPKVVDASVRTLLTSGVRTPMLHAVGKFPIQNGSLGRVEGMGLPRSVRRRRVTVPVR